MNILKKVQSIQLNLFFETILNFKGFLIAVAFSAAIGGMMTLVGTGPNIFVKGFADQ